MWMDRDRVRLEGLALVGHASVVDLDDDTLRELGYAEPADEYLGTAGAARYQQRHALCWKQSARLQVTNPTSALLAHARWGQPYENRLSLSKVAELVGRSKSTVIDNLNAIALRLALFQQCPATPAGESYRRCRHQIGREESAFLFWFDYTLSPTRAAQLSGHGIAGPSAARRRAMKKLERAAGADPCLQQWQDHLARCMQAMVQLGNGHGTSPLGKRRRGTEPRSNAPIPWLDAIDEPSDTDFASCLFAFGPDRIAELKAQACDDPALWEYQNPREVLMDALEGDGDVIGTALKILADATPLPDPMDQRRA
jgi:hypothetical protein